jgi:hypothetical protein
MLKSLVSGAFVMWKEISRDLSAFFLVLPAPVLFRTLLSPS